MKIYKYPLSPGVFDQTVDMPEGSLILSAGAQGQTIVVWTMVMTGAPQGKRRIRIVPTGEDIESKYAHAPIGRVEVPGYGGMLVFHLFDLGPE